MIGTIGSLVQEASNRRRWPLAVSLYIVSCLGTSMLVGAALGGVGKFIGDLVRPLGTHTPGQHAEAWLIASLALAYAMSDIGLLRLPRPTLRQAVPITWWRWWRPYGAALAYGSALGTGVMTRIPFGAFYVLCAWCVVKGNPAYGAAVIGVYGAARGLVLLPASWGAHCHHAAMTEWFASPLFSLWRAQRVVAIALTMFGTLVLVS